MSQHEARAWWADVEDLRERIESRRAERAPRADGRRELTAELPQRRARAARRTVQITGHPGPGPAAPPLVAAPHERPPRALTAATRNPDRIAGWAVLLGLVLVLVSTATN